MPAILHFVISHVLRLSWGEVGLLNLSHLVDGLALVAMKVVASCDKPRVGACQPLNLGSPNRTPWIVVWADAGNWNILVPAGEESKRDVMSNTSESNTGQTESGFAKSLEMWCRRGAEEESNALERAAKESDSLVN